MTVAALAAWGPTLAVRPSLAGVVVESVLRPGPLDSRVACRARASAGEQAPQQTEGCGHWRGPQLASKPRPAQWREYPRGRSRRQAVAQVRGLPPVQVGAPLQAL